MADPLHVEKREETGTLRMRRLRKAGKIPAVLYGHGEECISLTVSGKEMEKVISHGGHVVDLIGAVNESALIKEVQWDAFGSSVLHLDLTRVDANEQVEVTLPVELVGDAPGTHHGGVIKPVLHEVTILCAANKLVDSLELKINELELDQSLTAADLVLPEGASIVGSLEDVIVTCSEPTVQVEEDVEATGAEEPEVIGKQPDEESEDDD